MMAQDETPSDSNDKTEKVKSREKLYLLFGKVLDHRVFGS